MISTQNTVTDKLEYNHYNIDNVTVKGIESYLSWSFLRYFKLKAGYAYSDAIDESTGLQIFGNSKHTGTTSLTFYTSHKRYPLSVTMSGQIASPRLYQLSKIDKDGNEVVSHEKSEAFSIWRINYLQRLPIWKNITTDLQVGIDNIFDYKNTVRSAAINPGRMFWGSITVNFNKS
jgi:outer membrane receptor for ferrienterochelin and colicins